MKIPPYTEEQKEYILQHDGKITRRVMAQRLRVNICYLTAWAKELNGARGYGQLPPKPKKRKPGIFYHEKLATI